MADVQLAEPALLHEVRFPGEGDAYRAARDVLLRSEIALRRQTEAVAAQRRALPPGGEVPEDYVFEGEEGPVRFSELFGDKPTLAVYSYMYGPKMEQPCPSCTSIMDAMNGEARHVTRQIALAVVANSPLERLLAFTRSRSWSGLRLLSTAGNHYSVDYHGETAEGRQSPALNIFTRQDGKIRHAWCSELMFVPADPGQDPRHVDTIWPLWSLLDLTPAGRAAAGIRSSATTDRRGVVRRPESAGVATRVEMPAGGELSRRQHDERDLQPIGHGGS